MFIKKVEKLIKCFVIMYINYNDVNTMLFIVSFFADYVNNICGYTFSVFWEKRQKTIFVFCLSFMSVIKFLLVFPCALFEKIFTMIYYSIKLTFCCINTLIVITLFNHASIHNNWFIPHFQINFIHVTKLLSKHL